MTRSFVLLMLLALSCTPLSAQLSVSESGAVAGHLFCSDTQTPCRFAAVNIQSAPPAKDISATSKPSATHSYVAATDISGAFQISGVVPGEYYILGRLAGYISPYDIAAGEFPSGSPLSSQARDAALSQITVEVGKTTVANLTLSRGAALGGTILYDDGGLAIHVPVHIFRRDGTGKWQPYGNSGADSDLAPLGFVSHTDDRGKFYEPALPPGFYAVEATLPESALLPTVIMGQQSLNVKITFGDALQVFNDNKYRLREAPAIELHEGEARLDVDITIPTSGLHTLRGFVSGAREREGILRGTVRLIDPTDRSTLRSTDIHDDGSFLLNYVADGNYVVEVEAQADHLSGSPRYKPLATQLIVQNDMLDLSFRLAVVKN